MGVDVIRFPDNPPPLRLVRPDEESIDTGAIDRACAVAAGVLPETCCFCKQPIGRYTYPDRDVTGRVAHYHCSTPAWQCGDWTSRPLPAMAEYEEEDDYREWQRINGGGRS